MRNGCKRKWLFALLLALVAAFAAGCSGEKTPPVTPPEQDGATSTAEPASITVTYDNETGAASWTAVENATKYVVNVNLRHENDVYATYETTGLSQALPLKQGISLITVTAYNGQTEIGNGALTVELSLDFGHPDQPGDVAYNAADGVLTWSPAERAVRYRVTVKGITNKNFLFEAETEQTSQAVPLAGGVYAFSVVGLGGGGSAGPAAEFEYATFTAAEFDTDSDEDGLFDLFLFNDAGVADLMYSGEYREWASVVTQPATISIVDRATLAEPEGDLTDGALSVFVPSMTSAVMSGATIRLPEALSVGTLHFDLYRDGGNTTGVMLADEAGHVAYYGTSDAFAWMKWETISIDISAFLAKNPDLGNIREIGFYLRSTKGDETHYIDNLRYERIGGLGDVAYDTESRTLSWDAVFGATSYVVRQGETELYRGADTSVVLERPLDENDAVTCAITVEATDGERSKSKDYTLNFFGEIGAITLDEGTSTVSWDAVVGATSYVLYLNGEEAYTGTDTSFNASSLNLPADKDVTATLVAYRGAAQKEKTVSVRCVHGDSQLFGTQVDGGADNEYYIAEWHNLAAWGQFSSAGYAGGDPDGVTFTYGDWVYDDYENQTRLSEGNLRIVSGSGWANGAFGFVLPQALKISELYSISVRLKVTGSNNDGNAYFYVGYGGEKVALGDGGATSTTDGDWKVYTVSAALLSTLTLGAEATPVTAIDVLYVTANGGYSMDIQEVTYTKMVPQSFGQLKAGTDNEYYIAEWHNLAAWGQFSSAGYAGGDPDGVTFTYGDWVYDDYENQTRLSEGNLRIVSGSGWANGAFGFVLPQALKISELYSISVRLKVTGSNNDGNAYFYVGYGGEKVALGDGGATSTTDGDWKVYTVSAALLSTLTLGAEATPVTAIDVLYVTANGGYTMDIQEVTYKKVKQQSFGQLKAGTDNEYYIAEWSDLTAWGQFSSAGYTGGDPDGVTFTYNTTYVYDDYENQTRISQGNLRIMSGGSWSNGAFGFVLPQALKISEVSEITFRLKFAANKDGNSKPIFYINALQSDAPGIYIAADKVTIETDGEWSVCTIPASAFNATDGVTEIQTIYVTGNGSSYTLDIQEVTYKKVAA